MSSIRRFIRASSTWTSWTIRTASSTMSPGRDRPLDLPADHGQRRSQLVGCVGHELALVIEGVLQAVQHVVVDVDVDVDGPDRRTRHGRFIRDELCAAARSAIAQRAGRESLTGGVRAVRPLRRRSQTRCGATKAVAGWAGNALALSLAGGAAPAASCRAPSSTPSSAKVLRFGYGSPPAGFSAQPSVPSGR